MNYLILIIYELILWGMALCLLPKMLYQLIVHKKYQSSLLNRLGLNYPKINKSSSPLIWIHAVSVGETKAVVSLARELKRHVPGCQLIISSITETGYAEAKRHLIFADYHVYLPFDFSLIIYRLVAKVKPDLVILCESDFWYNFLTAAKKEGAAIALVNGKLSERSTKRFNKIPLFSRKLFNLFDLVCVQNDLYYHRFLNAYVQPERLVVTGNLKLDEDYPCLSKEEINQWRHRLGFSDHHLVLTIGSTHAPEEELLIKILKEIWHTVPDLKVILAPRHPERFKEVENLLQREQVPSTIFTNINHRTGKERVILIDTMGMLRMCYQLSDIALVGGSYTEKVGGHNVLEPCWYEKPVLFGPYTHAQVELVDLIRQYGAGVQVDEKELKLLLEHWLLDPLERTRRGKKGSLLMTNLKGSTKRTLTALMSSKIGCLSKCYPTS